MRTFRDKLALHLARTGLSQSDLARRTGLSASVVSRLMLNDADPALSTAARLAAGLGITVADLIDDRTNTPAEPPPTPRIGRPPKKP